MYADFLEDTKPAHQKVKEPEKHKGAPGYCLLLFSMSIVGLIFAALFCIVGVLMPAVTLITNETIRIPANSTDIYRVDLRNYGIVRITIQGTGIAADGQPVDAFYYVDMQSAHSGMLAIDGYPASNYFRVYATQSQGLNYHENHRYTSEFSIMNGDIDSPHITFQLTGLLQEGEFVITVQQDIIMKLVD